MVTETISQTTFQCCNLESPDGKKFLRKVIRECESLDWKERWGMRANPRTDWCLEFQRIAIPEIGEPERVITVRATTHVRIDYKAGDKQSFEDSKPVYLLGCTGICVTGVELPTICALLLHKNPRIWVCGHAGSSSSSEHGISFYELHMSTSDLHGSVQVGHHSIAVNGRRVCSGSVLI